MKALLLNSGKGTRMGDLTKSLPKCMTAISATETILSRQLNLLAELGIHDIVMTTGFHHETLVEYCHSLELPLRYSFVQNPLYDRTNYIYSIYLARKLLQDDLVFMHGDLVFERSILEDVIQENNSCMVVSSTAPLPEKDFKAVIQNSVIHKIGVNFFDNAVTAQPLYKLNKVDWLVWLHRIVQHCENGETNHYAENAFNEISEAIRLHPLDIHHRFCTEVDTVADLELVKDKLANLKLEQ